MRVAVVGGGIIGLSVARELCKSAEVTIFEKNRNVGRGATGAALGGITPQSDSLCRGPLRYMATWSAELYDTYLAEISDESDVDVPVVASGQIQVATSDAEMESLVNDLLPVWTSEGFTTHVLDRKETLEREPILGPQVVGSLLLPIEIALEPGRLVQGILEGLRRRNVNLLSATHVSRVLSGSSSATVVSSDGTARDFDAVVLASGLFTRELSDVIGPKLHAMRGQAMERLSGVQGYALNHHIYAANGGHGRSAYLVPRSDGRVAMGVTYEPGEEENRTVAHDMQAILEGCAEICPGVLDWPELRRWSGIRPASFDGRPFIGPVDEFGRLIVCAGHQGLGVTLAPVSALLVAALCRSVPFGSEPLGEREREALATCSPWRTQPSFTGRDRPKGARPGTRHSSPGPARSSGPHSSPFRARVARCRRRVA